MLPSLYFYHRKPSLPCLVFRLYLFWILYARLARLLVIQHHPPQAYITSYQPGARTLKLASLSCSVTS